MKFALSIVSAVLLSAPAFAVDAKQDAPVPMKDGDKVELICILDKATGFRFDKSTKQWTPEIFVSTDIYGLVRKDPGINEKILISVDGTNASAKLISKEKPREIGECKRNKSLIDCRDRLWTMIVDLETLKISKASLVGYVRGDDEANGWNLPSWLAIGRCSNLG